MKYLDNSNLLYKRESNSKLLCREDVTIVKWDEDFFVMKGQVKSQVGRLTKWVPLACGSMGKDLRSREFFLLGGNLLAQPLQFCMDFIHLTMVSIINYKSMHLLFKVLISNVLSPNSSVVFQRCLYICRPILGFSPSSRFFFLSFFSQFNGIFAFHFQINILDLM